MGDLENNCCASPTELVEIIVFTREVVESPGRRRKGVRKRPLVIKRRRVVSPREQRE